MEVLFDTLLITQDSESVLFYAVAGLYNLSNDASFAQMATRKPGVLAKLHSLAESANPDTVKYASGTVDNWCARGHPSQHARARLSACRLSPWTQAQASHGGLAAAMRLSSAARATALGGRIVAGPTVWRRRIAARSMQRACGSG